jgi:phosphatidylglycerophosphatase C
VTSGLGCAPRPGSFSTRSAAGPHGDRRGRNADVTDGRPVVWDLDGALTRTGNLLLPFLRRVAGTTALLRALTVTASGDLPRSNRRSAVKASVLQQVLGGLPVDEVDRVARDYATRVVATRLRADSQACWSWHHRQGHRLVIASASPGLYVRHIGRQLDADEVICSEMAIVNGHLTGAMRGGDCRGAEKARRVVAYLVEQPSSRVWAYANGETDQPLLSIADVAVRVTRSRRLACRTDP